MRGFLSLVLVLALVSMVFLASSTHVSNSRRADEAKNSALLLEKEYYGRAEVREAMVFALQSPDIGNAVARLKALDEFVNEDDVDVTIWCGLATEPELERLPPQMQESGAAKPCPSCWGVGSLVAGICCNGDECRPDFRNPCEFILSTGGGGTSIIGTDGTRTTDAGEECIYPEIAASSWKKAVVGASIYSRERNSSGLVVLPQGMVVEHEGASQP